MHSRPLFALVALATFAAGCSGGGSALDSALPSPGQQPSATVVRASAAAVAPNRVPPDRVQGIDAVNALGSPVKNLAVQAGVAGGGRRPLALGSLAIGAKKNVCNGYSEFFVPDRNGDPNSTENVQYYQYGCVDVARDVVRIYTISGTSETLARTMTAYAPKNSTPIAVRTESTQIANATFGANGFPETADGFSRQTQSQLTVGSSRSVNANSEAVVEPSSGSSAAFCMDSAGYNALGIAKLNETFGWQGGALSGGTVTTNADGSVTWSATHQGDTYAAPIGGLSIQSGTPNTACPITTPAYTLAGGTVKSSYTIPFSMTYRQGVLADLSVTNGKLANGDTLNVTSNSTVGAGNSWFILGSVKNGSRPVAQFHTNAYGDGVLRVARSGGVFTIIDWNVVR